MAERKAVVARIAARRASRTTASAAAGASASPTAAQSGPRTARGRAKAVINKPAPRAAPSAQSPGTTRVVDFKQKLQRTTGVDASLQRIFVGDRELSDTDWLTDYDLAGNARMVVATPGEGGGGASPAALRAEATLARMQEVAVTSEVARQFIICDEDIENANFTASLSPYDRYTLYALRQQALVGPCTESEPMFFDSDEVTARWQAWTELGDMPPDVAVHEYVANVMRLQSLLTCRRVVREHGLRDDKGHSISAELAQTLRSAASRQDSPRLTKLAVPMIDLHRSDSTPQQAQATQSPRAGAALPPPPSTTAAASASASAVPASSSSTTTRFDAITELMSLLRTFNPRHGRFSREEYNLVLHFVVNTQHHFERLGEGRAAKIWALHHQIIKGPMPGGASVVNSLFSMFDAESAKRAEWGALGDMPRQEACDLLIDALDATEELHDWREWVDPRVDATLIVQRAWRSFRVNRAASRLQRLARARISYNKMKRLRVVVDLDVFLTFIQGGVRVQQHFPNLPVKRRVVWMRSPEDGNTSKDGMQIIVADAFSRRPNPSKAQFMWAGRLAEVRQGLSTVGLRRSAANNNTVDPERAVSLISSAITLDLELPSVEDKETAFTGFSLLQASREMEFNILYNEPGKLGFALMRVASETIVASSETDMVDRGCVLLEINDQPLVDLQHKQRTHLLKTALYPLVLKFAGPVTVMYSRSSFLKAPVHRHVEPDAALLSTLLRGVAVFKYSERDRPRMLQLWLHGTGEDARLCIAEERAKSTALKEGLFVRDISEVNKGEPFITSAPNKVWETLDLQLARKCVTIIGSERTLAIVFQDSVQMDTVLSVFLVFTRNMMRGMKDRADVWVTDA